MKPPLTLLNLPQELRRHIYNHIFTPLEFTLTQNHQVGSLVLLSDKPPNSYLGALLSCRMICSEAINLAYINISLIVKYERSSYYRAYSDLEPYVPLAARCRIQRMELVSVGPFFTIISGRIYVDGMSDFSIFTGLKELVMRHEKPMNLRPGAEDSYGSWVDFATGLENLDLLRREDGRWPMNGNIHMLCLAEPQFYRHKMPPLPCKIRGFASANATFEPRYGPLDEDRSGEGRMETIKVESEYDLRTMELKTIRYSFSLRTRKGNEVCGEGSDGLDIVLAEFKSAIFDE